MRIKSEILLTYSWIMTQEVCAIAIQHWSLEIVWYLRKKKIIKIVTIYIEKKASVPSVRSSASCTVPDFSTRQYTDLTRETHTDRLMPPLAEFQ